MASEATEFASWFGTAGQWAGAIISAFAIIVALFKEQLLLWVRRPRLRVECINQLFSIDLNHGPIWLRLKLVNLPKSPTLNDLQVYLESICSKEDETSELVPLLFFVPIRLKWTHTGESSLDTLPPDSTRLVDFGAVGYHNGGHQLKLKLSTEIEPSNSFNLLSPGFYSVQMTISTATNIVWRGMIEVYWTPESTIRTLFDERTPSSFGVSKVIVGS